MPVRQPPQKPHRKRHGDSKKAGMHRLRKPLPKLNLWLTPGRREVRARQRQPARLLALAMPGRKMQNKFKQECGRLFRWKILD
jgi:hypothetical protein